MWELEKTGTREECQLFGVQIFQSEWNNTNQIASVRDPVSDIEMVMPVYTTDIDGRTLTFAAGELEDGLYGFYLWNNKPRETKKGKTLKLSHIVLLIIGAIAFAILMTFVIAIALGFGVVMQADGTL